MPTARHKTLPRRAPKRRQQGRPRANRRRGNTAKHAAVEPAAPKRKSRKKTAGTPSRFSGLGRRVGRFALRAGLTGGFVYGLLLAAQGVHDYATTSSRFEVKGLIFEPTLHVDDDHARELLDLEPGTNILALDLKTLGEQVAADPWVAKATVTRQLPDTLEVRVEEHVPRAVVLAGKFYLANEEGVVFKEAERGERGQLPIITGIDRTLLKQDRAAAEEKVRRGLEVLAVYESKRRPKLSEIAVGEAGEVALYTAESGTQLKLGRGDVDPKLARFDALRAAIGEKADELAVVHLDARSTPNRPDRVVAKFIDPNTEAVLLAEAQLERAKAKEEKLERSGAYKQQTQKDRAPKKKRIPKAY